MTDLEFYERGLELDNPSQTETILEQLISARDKITPLFNECIDKGISMSKEFPEVNKDWNLILLLIDKARRNERI